ncbi:MAG: amidohydrolase [Eubacteriales bacterium]
MKTAYINGKIFTSDLSNKYTSQFLVENGKFIKVRNTDELILNADKVVDLDGKTVIPGIVDAHMHPLMLADYSKQIACLPPSINSIKQLKSVIAETVKSKNPGEWILGWGYDEGKYIEGRSPNRWDLDEVAPNNPVFIVRSCEHIRCVNSKAFEICNITDATPDPQGGHLGRDERGRLTGILEENARNLVLPFMPKKTEEERVESLVQLGKMLASQGIVAVADMGNLHAGGNYEIFKKAACNGFSQKVSIYYMWDYFCDDEKFEITKEQLDYSSDIRIAGIKLIGDGSISGRTAWLKKPYLDTDNFGIPVYSDDSMEKAIRFAKKNLCQIAVHAMGGQAIDRVIERLSEESDWTDGRVPFLRIEHLTEPSENAMKKACECGFAFACQPIFAFSEIESYRKNLGEERIKSLYPFKNMLDNGVKMCISTDAPATSWAMPSEPFVNMKAAVTRVAYDGTDIGSLQKLDIETIVRLYTKEGAEISGMLFTGMIKEGYDADFIILSDDIFEIDPMKLDEIKVNKTYIKGECVFG